MARRRTHASVSPPQSIADLRLKLSRIIYRHDQLKIAFNQLQCHIRTGLLEAEDVFASLAIPLMNLVGLKTAEMAEEGRFSTIIVNNANSNFEDCWRNQVGSRPPAETVSTGARAEQCHKASALEEENYTSKATTAGKELMQKQKLQLMELIQILRQFESEVNSSQDDILQKIATRQESMHKFFQQAVKYISQIYQSGQDNGFCMFTIKLLKATFDHVGEALCSVEDGVEDLIHNLAEKMCSPMVKYVHGLTAEMTTGTCARLLSVIDEMGGAMRTGRLQLEEAKTKVKEAEETKLLALHRLKESEDRVRKMTERPGFLLEADKRSQGHRLQHMLLGTAADEKLLWKLLRDKRKYQLPDSPLAPKFLQGLETNNKKVKFTKPKPSISCRPTTRSQTQRLSSQPPCTDFRIPLGSSPSTAAQKVVSRRRVTP